MLCFRNGHGISLLKAAWTQAVDRAQPHTPARCSDRVPTHSNRQRVGHAPLHRTSLQPTNTPTAASPLAQATVQRERLGQVDLEVSTDIGLRTLHLVHWRRLWRRSTTVGAAREGGVDARPVMWHVVDLTPPGPRGTRQRQASLPVHNTSVHASRRGTEQAGGPA